jgi:hypothetical protein
LICNTPPEILDPHFRPQTYGCEDLFQRRDIRLYDINELGNLDITLKNQYNIDKIFSIHPRYFGVRPKLKEELVPFVQHYFKRDYELLSYPT